MLLHRDHRTGELYKTGVDIGKRIRPPLLVGKRTWKDTARTAGKGMLGTGSAWCSATDEASLPAPPVQAGAP